MDKLHSSFQWGSTNTSPGKLFGSSGIKNDSITKSRKNFKKIDPRIYADVNSTGLASRIVKYHESGVRGHRVSTSAERTIHFPGANSNHDLPYKARRQSVSMTHIAPPDKSSFYGNTLSGLLRSSSVLTLNQGDNDLSSENRPIIHPPALDKDTHPTRSVLDVLKEISRKRINNEDSEKDETSKKYCCRVDGHFPNSTQHIAYIPPYNGCKRQREKSGDDYNQTQELSYFSKVNKYVEGSRSPEQQQHAKRRYCNYNNDISSSLSSSKKVSTNKRKLFEEDEGKRQKITTQSPQTDIKLLEVSTALSPEKKATAITTSVSDQPIYYSSTANQLAAKQQKSLPIIATTSNLEPETLRRNFNRQEKPKLTLFNKNYDPSASSVEQEDNKDHDYQYSGIQFIKPKRSVSVIGGESSNQLIKRTQQSKLALMLSGLRGELYLGEENENQSVKTSESDTKVGSDFKLSSTISSMTKESSAGVSETDASNASSISNNTGQLTSNPTPLTTEVKLPSDSASTNSSKAIASATNIPPATSFSLESSKAPSMSPINKQINSVAPTFSLKTTPTTSVPNLLTFTPAATSVATTSTTFSINATATTTTTTSILQSVKPLQFPISTSSILKSNVEAFKKTETTTAPAMPTFTLDPSKTLNFSTAIPPAASVSTTSIATTTTTATTTKEQSNFSISQPLNPFPNTSAFSTAAVKMPTAFNPPNSTAFNQPNPNNTVTNLFGAKPLSFPAAANPPQLGKIATPAGTPIFQAPAPTTSDTSKATNLFTTSEQGKQFSFGTTNSTSVNQDISKGTTTTTQFTFGSNNNASKPLMPAEPPKTTNLFDLGNSGTKPNFSFTNPSVEAPKPTAGFSFGQNPTPSNTTMNIAPGKEKNMFNFNSQNSEGGSAFVFGKGPEETKSNNGFPSATTQQNSTKIFGGQANNTFSFSQPKNGTSETNNTLGGIGNVFSFSQPKTGNGEATNTQNQNGFSFAQAKPAGTTATINPLNPNSNGFSFSQPKNKAPEPNISGNNSSANIFSFGKSSNGLSTTTTQLNPAGSTSNSNSTSQKSAFIFGGGINSNSYPTTDSPVSRNLFSLPASNEAKPQSPFTLSTTTTNNPLTSNPTSNLFAVPPGTDRPIRKATRRLTKS